MPALKQRLTGNEVRQLRDALVEAFSPEDLRQVVFYGTDREFHNWVNTEQTLPGKVFELILAADRKGKLESLFRAALKENPIAGLRCAMGQVLQNASRAEDLESIV